METIKKQKEQLVKMIESVNDPEVLLAVKGLLSESENSYERRQTLNTLAEEAEHDYKLGKGFTSEEFKLKIDAKLPSKG
jgi:hypothetical protein